MRLPEMVFVRKLIKITTKYISIEMWCVGGSKASMYDQGLDLNYIVAGRIPLLGKLLKSRANINWQIPL